MKEKGKVRLEPLDGSKDPYVCFNSMQKNLKDDEIGWCGVCNPKAKKNCKKCKIKYSI